MTKLYNLDNPAPFVSARSWLMMNIDTGEIMFAKQETVQRQVASLTKIVTMCVVLDLIERYDIDPVSTKINVLESSTTPFLGGTSAELLAGDKISIQELLYGMMLPSGNDAAQTLAIYFGNLLLLLKEKHGQVVESIISDKIIHSAKTIDANIYDD